MHEPGLGPAAVAGMIRSTFTADGFVIVPGILGALDCTAIDIGPATLGASGGTRCLLNQPWCQSLALRLREHPLLRPDLPDSHVAVQCTYFEKSVDRNWLVPLHQDLSIPVAERIDGSGLSGWSEKEGQRFVHAPRHLLEHLIAVRLHLDACTEDDGPIRVVPGSHRDGLLSAEATQALRHLRGEQVCTVSQGGALLMRPLLLHASSKASGGGRRRVLHFLYGPRDLSHGLRWAMTV